MDQIKSYKGINNLIGWAIFIKALAVFMLTLEPTASFWDSGQFVATSYRLQVSHPPGAPLYQLMARMFSLLAMGDVTRVAFWINSMSAVFAALTVMYLFWSVSFLGHKIMKSTGDTSSVKTWAVWGAGIVGALTFTFSESFWFSAVEAEVYVPSMFLTAFVFWAILKWESTSDDPQSMRWIVMIAFVMGLSIGVHMLNLLVIPAIVFVYYFKKFQPTRKGIILTGIISFLILGIIYQFLIPGVLKWTWLFERFFTNSIGLPFYSGTIIFFLLLISSIVYGLYWTYRKKRVILNTVILGLTFILIGYTTYMSLVVRSNANVPINQNAPKSALALYSYLGREQYGAWPILHGPYYNAPLKDIEDGNPIWRKDLESGRYVIISERPNSVPIFDPEFTTLFPRMHSSSPHHIRAYETWGNVTGRPTRAQRMDGTSEVINKPTFGENLRFFFSYQLGHMYLRYFMWNFAGRQNDTPGHGSPIEGNWISGIPPLDSMFLGPQKNLPSSLADDPSRSTYFLLPFILGIIGLIYHSKKRPDDASVLGMLFFMTGIAIILYLNQTPYQPRERDYSYVGSFYAFTIWIGLGVLAIFDFLQRKLNGKVSAILASVLCLALVPTIMAVENWESQDRSGRYTARDVAINYLESCAPNAILFTMGDNDTFPLWYAQHVEGIRTDVRVVNLSLLNTDWYIDGMMRRKAFDGKPVPFTLQPIQYRDGTRDLLHVIEDPRLEGRYVNLRSVINFVTSDDNKRELGGGRLDNFFPTRRFRIPVDSATVVNNGTVAPEDAHLIVDYVEWEFPENFVQKNNLMVLDFLATNNWERPVYFAITTGSEAYIGLEEYFQLEGMTYRLVPIRTPETEAQTGRINTRILHDNIMNKFKWGNMYDPEVNLDVDNLRLAINFKNIFQRLADALILEGQTQKAIEVLDRAMAVLPEHNVPYNFFSLMIAEAYYNAGAIEQGNKIMESMMNTAEENLKYYFTFSGRMAEMMEAHKQESLAVIQRISMVTERMQIPELQERSSEIFNYYYQQYMLGFR